MRRSRRAGSTTACRRGGNARPTSRPRSPTRSSCASCDAATDRRSRSSAPTSGATSSPFGGTPRMTEAAPTPAARSKVLYLMGSGHSGSTILGVTLGNCEGFFYAGELDNWLVRKGASVLGGAERTRFWNEVRAGVDGTESLFCTDAQRYLERSSAILRPGKAGVRAGIRARWGPVAETLYRSIARTSGASHIVDSAHFPLRARELKALAGLDVYLIFLVRDPQQVVHSFVKRVNRHAHAERSWL